MNNWGSQCKFDKDCCDPGAYCNNNNYRQCQQPVSGSGRCVSPASRAFPTTTPVKFSPVTKPIVKMSPVSKPVYKQHSVPSSKPFRPNKKPVSKSSGNDNDK